MRRSAIRPPMLPRPTYPRFAMWLETSQFTQGRGRTAKSRGRQKLKGKSQKAKVNFDTSLLPSSSYPLTSLRCGRIHGRLNLALVLDKELVEVLELGIERPRGLATARSRDFLFEVAVHLKHVAHLVCAREAKAAIDVGVDGVVLH